MLFECLFILTLKNMHCRFVIQSLFCKILQKTKEEKNQSFKKKMKEYHKRPMTNLFQQQKKTITC